MSKKITWVKSSGKLIITCEDFPPINLQSNMQQYKTAMRYIRANKIETLTNYLFPVKRVETFSKNKFTLVEKGSTIQVVSKEDNSVMPQPLAKKLLEFAENSYSFRAYVNFWKNLQKNPNKSSIEQLFLFLEHYKYPITSDGCFLAYKYVTPIDGHLYDTYSRTILNDVGCIVAIDRNKCVVDHNECSSSGLHVAAYEYATNYGGSDSQLIVVKVNPKDVVAVPRDYTFKKMRVCRYEVIAKGTKAIQEGETAKKEIAKWKNEIDKSYVSDKDLEEIKFNIDGLTAQQIIDKAKTDFNEDINISVKNKKAIVKKFISITESKNSKIINTKSKLSLKDKTAQQIVDEVFTQTGERITTSLKNKKIIMKKAVKILTHHGFNVIQ